MHQIRRQSNAQTSDVLTLSSSSDCELANGAYSKKPGGKCINMRVLQHPRVQRLWRLNLKRRCIVKGFQINANNSDDIQTISSGSDVEEDKKNVTSATAKPQS
ncbi:uncharacterized protein LOC142095800 isoform X2 [Mixophyes fleayi]|uniref:uncharacterized protein LOC142095800 isoform X2 n=1 Tax=Mixophyes fleayi TaxID=3061075 RepID=UPI003F4DA373